MNTQINIIRTYTTPNGVIGAVYTLAGRVCSTFVGRVKNVLEALKTALDIKEEGRELDRSESLQLYPEGPQPYKGAYRWKASDRANRRWWLPEAGTLLRHNGATYRVTGQGKTWEKARYMYCYMYCEMVSGDAATPAPVAAAVAPLATEKQIAYALRLGAANARKVYDTFDRYPFGFIFSRAQLGQMTRNEISGLIEELRA